MQNFQRAPCPRTHILRYVYWQLAMSIGHNWWCTRQIFNILSLTKVPIHGLENEPMTNFESLFVEKQTFIKCT